MKLNIEATLNKEEESDMIENIQSLVVMLNLMSSVRINSEYVDNNDGTVTIRLLDYEVTQDTIEDLNQQTINLMSRFPSLMMDMGEDDPYETDEE